MRQLSIVDFLRLDLPAKEHKLAVNVRGCNGAGKSTIPFSLWENDPDTFEVYWKYTSKPHVIATVSPKYGWLALGRYQTKTGGMDSLSSTQEIKDAAEVFWTTGYHLLMEGVVASTVRGTYVDLFNDLNQRYQPRKVVIYNLLPPLETCLQRIQQRNGGKEIKDDLVGKKWKIVERNAQKFKELGFNSIVADNSNITREQTREWFFNTLWENNVEEYQPMTKVSKDKFQAKIASKIPYKITSKYYVEPDENIKHYDWYPDYKAPDETLDIDLTYFNSYWGFIAERMNIWYKRVMLGEPAPWTDDPILQNFKFTNVIRDLDKLSIYERRHILSKIDEIQDDWSEDKKLKWKQSILLNIMIFRLWVKIDTYEVHGFIDLTTPDWKTKWDKAVVELLKRREDGVSNFTAAYYVCDLRAVNPDPDTKNNKTANAIAMVEGWMNHIDEIYDGAIVKPQNMKEQLKYFKSLLCVGDFTAYEYACSITEITRYCKNHLIEWTQDNATNVGPGAHRGIEWIFKNKGGMSDYQCILYLRSIWKHELQRLGTYDRFISQLPKEMNGDIDLRVIEHCLCECQKYNKAWTKTGRPKETFKPKTIDMNELKG